MTRAIFDQMGIGDILLWISPQSWSSPSNKILKLMRENQVNYVSLDTDEYFEGIGSSFSDYSITKTTTPSTQTTPVSDRNHSPCDIDFKDLFYLPNDACALSLSIHRKVMFGCQNYLDVRHDYVTNHNILLRTGTTLSKTSTPQHIHPVFHTNRQTWFSSVRQKCMTEKKVVWTRSGYLKPFYDDGTVGITDMAYYIPVKSRATGERLVENLSSPLMEYIFTTAKWSGFGNERVFERLPQALSTVRSHDLAKHFSLTPEEVAYIKNQSWRKTSTTRIPATPEYTVKTQTRSDIYGEVFTPPELVNKMLDKLPPGVWARGDESWTFLDPACGNGNFLVEVLRRHLDGGVSPDDALRSIYGIDIMPDNVLECRHRLLAMAMQAQLARQPDENPGAADEPTASFNMTDLYLIVMKRIALANSLEDSLENIFPPDAPPGFDYCAAKAQRPPEGSPLPSTKRSKENT
jgi:hypothetical protein